MTRRQKFAIALAIVLIASALLIGRYFADQSDLHATALKNMTGYWKVGTVENLKREAALARDANRQVEEKLPLNYGVISDVETTIYVQVRQRIGHMQNVRIYLLLRNASWISSANIDSPHTTVFEWWKEPPSSVQIRNSIYSTAVNHFRGAEVLRPRQFYLIYTDFQFPYPMALDFTIHTSFLENWFGGHTGKLVTDSVIVRGQDLNTVEVLP